MPKAKKKNESTQDDPEKPITSGFYRIEKGATMTATYTYYEFKLVVAGDLVVSDSTGQKVKAMKGDILYFPKGATSTDPRLQSLSEHHD